MSGLKSGGPPHLAQLCAGRASPVPRGKVLECMGDFEVELRRRLACVEYAPQLAGTGFVRSLYTGTPTPSITITQKQFFGIQRLQNRWLGWFKNCFWKPETVLRWDQP